MHESFMRLAIKEARKSSESLKCGVVIVREGEVLAQAFNSQRSSCDASAHAEIKALREAGQRVSNKNLVGCVAYCTCEPCIMCLSALAYAKIETLVYGVPLELVSSKEHRIDIPLEKFLEKSPFNMKVVKEVLIEECKKLYGI